MRKKEKEICDMRFRHILGDPEADGVGKGKSKWAGKNGAKKSKGRTEELFWVPEDNFEMDSKKSFLLLF